MRGWDVKYNTKRQRLINELIKLKYEQINHARTPAQVVDNGLEVIDHLSRKLPALKSVHVITQLNAYEPKTKDHGPTGSHTS